MRFALFTWMAIGILAQPVVEIRHVTGGASSRLTEAERWWRTAQHAAWREARAPEEREMVTAVTAIYREVFQPEIGPEPKIVTLTEKGQDILAVRWTGRDSMSPFSEMIAWDTPNQTSFIFRLPPGRWSSGVQIQSTFEQLLLPPATDGHTPPATGVTVNIARDPRDGRWIGAGGFLIKYAPRQFDFGSLNWFDLWQSADGSYLAAGFHEFQTFASPRNMRGIAERFPPLEARVGSWSKGRILEELGHGGVFEALRDSILARELLKRAVTNEELLAVLERRRPDESGALLNVIVQERHVKRFEGAIHEYLRDDSGCGKCNEAFNIVRRSDEVDFTDVALDVVRREHDSVSPITAAPFVYVTDHGTAADYKALLDLPSSQRVAHKFYLEMMRQRLGLAEESNPKPSK